MNRYVSRIELFVYGVNDKDAKKQIDKLCKKLNDKFDCRAELTKLDKLNFGSLIPKPVEIEKI